MKSLLMTAGLLTLLLGGPLWIVATGMELSEEAREQLCGQTSLDELSLLDWVVRTGQCLSDGDKLTLIQYPALAALFRDRLFGLHSLPRDLKAVTQTLTGVQTNLQQVVHRLAALERK